MKRLYTFITLLFLCVYSGIAQENLKKHTVSYGETLLSISKKYNITPYDLQKANPGVIDGIKIDDVIIIPESKITTPSLEGAADSAKASGVSSSISHTIKTGDTKFSVSKRFGLTVSELESQNPQIVSGLNVGQVLEIYPSTTPVNTEAISTQPNPINKKGKTHRVLKGETLFGISSANGLTVDALVEANSNTISGSLKEGQILWIPGSDDDTASGTIEEYLVRNGDTKFSLARRFNTSIGELERKNPHITKMLIVGQTIKIPSSRPNHKTTQVARTESSNAHAIVPTNAVKEEVEIITIAKVPSEAPFEEIKKEDEKVVNNEIVQKEKEVETVVSKPVLAEKSTLKETNENLVVTNTSTEKTIEKSTTTTAKESVLIDNSIKTPNDGTVPYAVSNKTSNTTEALVLPKVTSGLADLKTSANTAPSKRLLFFLPFSEMDYQNHMTSQDHFKNVSDDFKRAHLEFYEGANIAIDSIRKMNLHLEVNIVEAQSTNQTSKTKSLIQDHNIKDYDAIILPFYKTVEDEIAAFTADSNIPVITASTIDYKSNTNNLYSALPSINFQRLKVLNYMMAKQAHIIVLSDANRIESKIFIANHVPKVDFIDIKKNGSFNEAELKSKLKKDQLNYVIIDSERNGVFLNTTNALLGELSNYKLQLAVLETSLIPDDSNVSQKRYQILKMIFPSLIPAKSTESSKQFLSAYQKENKLLPSANVMLGFDITFDSLLRLMQQQSFENSALNYMTEYTQLKFNYKKNTLGGYSNEGIYILQYDADANIRDAN